MDDYCKINPLEKKSRNDEIKNMYYSEAKSIKEIAKIYNLSEIRIRKIIKY